MKGISCVPSRVTPTKVAIGFTHLPHDTACPFPRPQGAGGMSQVVPEKCACDSGESRGPYSRGLRSWAPAFAGVTIEFELSDGASVFSEPRNRDADAPSSILPHFVEEDIDESCLSVVGYQPTDANAAQVPWSTLGRRPMDRW